MENASKLLEAKRARKQRVLILRDSRSKRIRQTPLQHNTSQYQQPTSNLITKRIPLSKIILSQQNQKTVRQIVEEGSLLTARILASEPCHSRHMFHPTNKFSKLHSLGTNLLSKFSNSLTWDINENYSQSDMRKTDASQTCRITPYLDVDKSFVATK